MTTYDALPTNVGRGPSRGVRGLVGKATATCAAVVLFAIVGLEGPGPASGAVLCPKRDRLQHFKVANSVGASFTINGSKATYTFDSLDDQSPSGGLPGLMQYCVYPDGGTPPIETTALAQGAFGADWIDLAGRDRFSFSRPGGPLTNISLDGSSTLIGAAEWMGPAPSSQAILLRIRDEALCASLYPRMYRLFLQFGVKFDEALGITQHFSCFVKPSTQLVCDRGPADPSVVYTAMSRDMLRCVKVPSWAFEATSTSEFGDEVSLESTGFLASLRVLFLSYGCGTSGHWHSNDCVTGQEASFTHPITANIYRTDGTVIASVTQDFDIAYRPSKDDVHCTGANAGQFYNPTTGWCHNALPQILTFTFPGAIALPRDVRWTVAFNTTHYGEAPIGEAAACFRSAAGCGYDALNVGIWSLAGSPYAGTDIDPDGVWLDAGSVGAYCDDGAGGKGFLRSDPGCWTGYRPLGEIRIQ